MGSVMCVAYALTALALGIDKDGRMAIHMDQVLYEYIRTDSRGRLDNSSSLTLWTCAFLVPGGFV